MSMKKIMAILLAVLMLFGMTVSMTSCSPGQPPELEDVYGRLVEVIEGAHDVNAALFGIGLPTHERDSEESILNNVYYGAADDGLEFVSEYSRFHTMEEIREAASRVYGSDYCTSLFESIFTGYAYAEGGGDHVLPARYSEKDGMMYQSRYVKPLVYGQRTYDYASMEIVSGHATYIEVSIRSYGAGTPGQWITGDLGFVYENGNWYLDGPSC